MRTIKLPDVDWNELHGHSVSFPVLVGWPELQLTEDQHLANAIAVMNFEDPPYEEPIIEVVVPVPAAVLRERLARADSAEH